jgi:hypothetical protein
MVNCNSEKSKRLQYSMRKYAGPGKTLNASLHLPAAALTLGNRCRYAFFASASLLSCQHKHQDMACLVIWPRHDGFFVLAWASVTWQRRVWNEPSLACGNRP